MLPVAARGAKCLRPAMAKVLGTGPRHFSDDNPSASEGRQDNLVVIR